jgi:adenine-specific DNA-methyltransferase
MKLRKNAMKTVELVKEGAKAALFVGDCLDLLAAIDDESVDLTVTSPPYCMGKEYEKSTSVQDFIDAHRKLLPEIARITRTGGSICWQVGYHVASNATYPLDFAVFEIMKDIPEITLRNRVIWSFSHGLHGTKRFSGRHETILWFVKGRNAKFNLDAVRIPQKYPGKRSYKGPNKGNLSGNPLGKNPGDVWDIPNVKGNHVEKTEHPCQFPVALVQRLIRATTAADDLVLDPFAGSGSTGVAAAMEGRRFIGAEIEEKYAKVGAQRVIAASRGHALVRPLDQPIYEPSKNSAVARRPEHFIGANEHA